MLERFLLYVEPITGKSPHSYAPLFPFLPWTSRCPFYNFSLFTLVAFPLVVVAARPHLPLLCSPVFHPPPPPSTQPTRRVVAFVCVYETVSPALAKGMQERQLSPTLSLFSLISSELTSVD